MLLECGDGFLLIVRRFQCDEAAVHDVAMHLDVFFRRADVDPVAGVDVGEERLVPRIERREVLTFDGDRPSTRHAVERRRFQHVDAGVDQEGDPGEELPHRPGRHDAHAQIQLGIGLDHVGIHGGQDHLGLDARLGKGLVAPRVPVHGIVGVLEQVGAALARESIHPWIMTSARAGFQVAEFVAVEFAA